MGRMLVVQEGTDLGVLIRQVEQRFVTAPDMLKKEYLP